MKNDGKNYSEDGSIKSTHNKSKYTTKVTWLGSEYGCRVFFDGKVVVEGRCATKELIGPTFRDLLRSIDKCGGDKFTSAARKRKYKEGNLCVATKHWWGGKSLPN